MLVDRKVVTVRPNPTTFVRKYNRLYYALVHGIGIVSFDNNSFKTIYLDNNSGIWGAFHFCIEYEGRIIFIPKAMNELFILSPEDESLQKVCISDKKDDEALIPFISDADLMLFGLQTQKFFVVDSSFSVSVYGQEKNVYNWKSHLSQTAKYVCLWDDEKSKIGVIDKNLKKLKIIGFENGNIESAAVYGEYVYVLTDVGEIVVLSIEDCKALDIIHTGIKANNNRILFKNDMLYVMPTTGDEIVKIALGNRYEISVEKIGFDAEDKTILWSLLPDDTVLCMIQQKNDAWKYKMGLFEYSLSKGQLIEYPIEILASSYFCELDDGEFRIEENHMHTLNDFIAIVERK